MEEGNYEPAMCLRALSHNDRCHADNCYLQAGEETESEQLNHLAWAHSLCIEPPLPQPVFLACLTLYVSDSHASFKPGMKTASSRKPPRTAQAGSVLPFSCPYA